MDPYTLLREILAKDRAAIAGIEKSYPGFQPSDEILDLHRRIEEVLSQETNFSPGLFAENERLRRALGRICEFGTENPGYGRSCAYMASKALGEEL